MGADQFTLIEVGSGNGEFLEGVLNAINEKQESKKKSNGLRVWAVERSQPARDLLYKRLSRFPRCQVVASMDDIDWMGTLEGCIFSNELMDALPFHRVRKKGEKWVEILVTEKDGALVEVEGGEARIENRELKMEEGILDGHELEIRRQIPTLYEEWGARLSRGYVLTVDYGHPRESFLSPSRSKGTMMCYHRHEASKNPFLNLGEQDITAHVDFSQLARVGKNFGFDPLLFCSQGIFLSHLGQKHIESYLAHAPEDEKRRRVGAIQQLIHPDAMGEIFWVLLQAKGVEIPPAFAALPNRLRRLV